MEPLTEEQIAEFLTVAQVRGAKDREPVSVDVPQWGGKLLVVPFNMEERRSVRKVGQTVDSSGNVIQDAEEMELEAFIQGVRNPARPEERLFKRGDKAWLKAEKSSGAISKVVKVILDSSGLGKDAVGKPEESSEETPN